MNKIDLNIQNVLSILLRALDYIDVRLVDHGYRVAYIVYEMLKEKGTYSEKEMHDIILIAALHDIGAYKTEEIENMIQFESDNVYDHSIYGYLFLKHMTPLKDWAEVVLYHHIDYIKSSKIESSFIEIADIVHLADRIDVTLQKKGTWLTDNELSAAEGKKFSKESIELFKKANLKKKIEKNIMNGSYIKRMSKPESRDESDDELLLDYIKMIAYSVDFRSENTVNHVISTVSIAEELARIYGLTEKQIEKIILGSYLHDIGKIGTPMTILEKPGKLDEQEMNIMKEHISIGKNILETRIEDEVVKIACRHHEKIDGSGYPDNIPGNQLSVSERIVAVADIMSALAGKRSYKDCFPKEKVIEIIKKESEEEKICKETVNLAILHYDRIMDYCSKNNQTTIAMYKSIKEEFEQQKTRLENF